MAKSSKGKEHTLVNCWCGYRPMNLFNRKPEATIDKTGIYKR